VLTAHFLTSSSFPLATSSCVPIGVCCEIGAKRARCKIVGRPKKLDCVQEGNSFVCLLRSLWLARKALSFSMLSVEDDNSLHTRRWAKVDWRKPQNGLHSFLPAEEEDEEEEQLGEELERVILLFCSKFSLDFGALKERACPEECYLVCLAASPLSSLGCLAPVEQKCGVYFGDERRDKKKGKKDNNNTGRLRVAANHDACSRAENYCASGFSSCPTPPLWPHTLSHFAATFSGHS